MRPSSSNVIAEEPGVLVSARVNAKRLAGAAQPRIAVLRPDGGDEIGVTIAEFAPLPVVSREAAVHEAQNLHLRVEPGDSIGFLMPTGQVDLGVKMRPRPDGAVQWFREPCGPCHMDGGRAWNCSSTPRSSPTRTRTDWVTRRRIRTSASA